MKIIAESPHELFTVTHIFFLFVTRYFMSWTHKSALTFVSSEVWTITHCLGLGHKTMVCAVCLSVFLSPLSPRTDFSHLALWCSHNWSVTSDDREVLVLDVIFICCYWTRKFAQSWYSLMNNNREYRFPAIGVHNLACKNCVSYIINIMVAMIWRRMESDQQQHTPASTSW